MHHRWLAFVIVVLEFCLVGSVSGCAYVTAVPVKPGSNVSGIRIYDVKPILIVNGQTAQIEMVPNYNRAYALQFGAFLAKNDFQATINNGLISQVHANMDSTDFIKFLSDILKTVNGGQGLSAPGQPNPAGGVENRFQVFDIVFDDQGNLVGLRPLVIQADLLHVKTSRVSQMSVPPPIVVPQDDNNTVTPGPIH